MDDRARNKRSTRLFLVWLACCLALPALAYMVVHRLPSYVPHLTLGIVVLFFTTLGFLVGLRRDRSARDDVIDRTLQSALVALFFLAVVVVTDGTRDGSLPRSLATSATTISLTAASALISFFIGLWTYRHKGSAQSE